MNTILKQRSFWFGTLLLGTPALIIMMTQNPLFRGRSSKISALPVYGQVADFNLIERSGKPVSLADLKGKVWVADFIFTRCSGICPVMSGKMNQIQKQLKDHPDIRFVSFSVDPERDTPEVLTEYANRYHADPKKWLFVTGDKTQIFRLSEQHFHLGVADIPEAEREGTDQSVAHSSKFVLVDPQGQIRGYYSSEENNFLETLMRDIHSLI